jgi:branched-chain amino acid transport system substrate-binding protein
MFSMIKKPAARGIAVSACAALLLSACGGVVKEDGKNADPAADLPDAEIVSPIAGMECKTDSKPTGDPIVVGGSLSLTGPLAPTATLHKAVGDLVVEWVNECGGIDGRPLEWKVLDDQGAPATVTSNYERLIGDKVDFVMGPYGGAAALAGAGPVARAGYAYPTATNGAPDKLIGENHFPSWQIGGGVDDPAKTWEAQAQTFVDALESGENPPKSVFYATSKFPTTLSYVSATKPALEASGAKTVGDVEYDLGTTDFSSIAIRIQNADPDLVYVGGLGADITNLYQAFDAIGYTPKGIYVALPAPAAVQGLGDKADGLLLSSIYENHPPLGDTDVAKYFAKAYSEVAAEEKLFPLVETQAAAGFSAWQILLTGINEAGVDNKAVIEWLNGHDVDTLVGTVNFDGFNNYGTDFTRVAQIQDGKRVLVWPKDVAGADIDEKP